jgi:hypothetical protein
LDIAVLQAQGYKPQAGWVIWCKSYQGATNTIRIMAYTPYYPITLFSCGVQNKAPYNRLESIKEFLDQNTGDVWTVITP